MEVAREVPVTNFWDIGGRKWLALTEQAGSCTRCFWRVVLSFGSFLSYSFTAKGGALSREVGAVWL